jgi:predicted PolB exonuclease-like 3'-5' exonuclease
LISSFVERIAELSPQLVTFNGSSFDLPVLRYRAMVHGVAAPGLSSRPYFNRYTEDAVDLCDVLSSFSPQGKVTLHELCRVMGLPGKPDGISGAGVDTFIVVGAFARSPNTARAMSSTPIVSGCVTNFFADDFRPANFKQARPASSISSGRAATRSRTLLI